MANFVLILESPLIKRYVGHSDAIWDVKAHPTAPLLLSASADGSLKLWDIQKSVLRSTFWYTGSTKKELSKFESPTSICWKDSNTFYSSFRNSIVSALDVETRLIKITLRGDETFGTLWLTKIIHQEPKSTR
jgi:striatin 1/3/4